MRLTKKVEDKAAFHVCDKTCLSCDGTSCGFTQAIVDRLAAYEDTGFEPEEIDFCLSGAITPQEAKERYEAHKKRYDEWFAWKQAEEQGRLVILPKTLYEADDTPLVTGVTEWKVTGVRFYDGVAQAYTVKTKNVQTIIWGEEIGKTVFLARADAEAALKGEREDV